MISSSAANNNEEEHWSVLLRLNKTIAQLLRIFANTYGEGVKYRREKNWKFLSEEVTKIVETLASDSSGPAQEPFPDSLKQHLKNLWKNANYNKINMIIKRWKKTWNDILIKKKKKNLFRIY